MNKRLEEKIEKSINVFREVYTTFGFGKGPGREDSPNYYKLLNPDGTSKIVGNSSFSPRIRMLPVYYNRPEPYQGWTIPHHCRWVLSLHPRLTDGIKERIDPTEIYEIELNSMTLDIDAEGIIRDFIKLTNKEVMEKFIIPYTVFSEESRKIMEEVDKRNALLYRTEEALKEFKANDLQAEAEKGKEKSDDERMVS